MKTQRCDRVSVGVRVVTKMMKETYRLNKCNLPIVGVFYDDVFAQIVFIIWLDFVCFPQQFQVLKSRTCNLSARKRLLTCMYSNYCPILLVTTRFFDKLVKLWRRSADIHLFSYSAFVGVVLSCHLYVRMCSYFCNHFSLAHTFSWKCKTGRCTK